MKKYYTPNISEFYIGFEYEQKVYEIDLSKRDNERFNNNKFDFDVYIKIYPDTKCDWLFLKIDSRNPINQFQELLDYGRVRVKCLDKTDTGSFEFVEKIETEKQ